MKRRHFPLRGDHELLTPDQQTLSGVKLCEQVRWQGVASPPRHLRDLSVCDTAAGSTRRRSAASPTRRLRFEDETETEAESRYLERQRRRAGRLETGVLASKPDLNVIIRRTTARQEEQADRRPAAVAAAARQTRGTAGGVAFHPSPPLTDHKTQTLIRHRLNVRTEPIRETYIGSVSPGEAQVGRGGAWSGRHMQVRRRADPVRFSETLLTQAPPSTDLPINPYDPCMAANTPTDLPAFFRCPPAAVPPPVASVQTSQRDRLNGGTAGQPARCAAAAKPHPELRVGSELEETRPSPGGGRSETTVDSQAWPSSGSDDEQASLSCGQPLTSAHRDEPSRLSLRRLFSTVRLSRTRTGSLTRLTSDTFCNPNPSSAVRPCGLLRKSASVQSLYVQGSPVLPLKQSSTSQSVQREQKKRDRSVDYRPTAEQPVMSRCLSMEDIGVPCSLRPVGRLLEVCFDGTFLLELNRPTGQTYGFIISRGRGRPDSGVYVEDMVDSRTEKLYAGLLSVGDEILEVNEEKVACLSLDQVTRLLTRNPRATIRVLRHQRP